MSERTVLKWKDYSFNWFPAAQTKQGKRWNIRVWEGPKENPTYALSVSEILIIQTDILSIENAKQMAQDLQDVLDGHVPGFSFPPSDDEELEEIE